MINSFFLIFITIGDAKKILWITYLWYFTILFIICFSIFIWGDYNTELKKKDNKLFFKKWLNGKRLKALQLLMVFLIFIQSFVIFPYVFEPVIGWKAEQNKKEIKETVNLLIEEYNYTTDEDKTIVLLNWFERYSGNMYNNWGTPTLITGFIRPMCLSFGDGHGYFYLFCNFYLRTINRDYPAWVFTTRSGRCEEHSLLFREMASAADLEVRSVIGKEFDHQWAEVKINDVWITVDPANVVHNRIWLNSNYTGYNLSRDYFLKRFTKNDVAFIFAEYLNGTKIPVTDRYVKNTSMVNVTVIDDDNKPVKNIDVTMSSGSWLSPIDFECRFQTDDQGKCQIRLGSGTITFKAHTDGFFYKSGEVTRVLDGNKSIDITIDLKNDYTNVLYLCFLFFIIITFLVVINKIKKKHRKTKCSR